MSGGRGEVKYFELLSQRLSCKLLWKTRGKLNYVICCRQLRKTRALSVWVI
jgi:hypothetical protein